MGQPLVVSQRLAFWLTVECAPALEQCFAAIPLIRSTGISENRIVKRY